MMIRSCRKIRQFFVTVNRETRKQHTTICATWEIGCLRRALANYYSPWLMTVHLTPERFVTVPAERNLIMDCMVTWTLQSAEQRTNKLSNSISIMMNNRITVLWREKIKTRLCIHICHCQQLLTICMTQSVNLYSLQQNCLLIYLLFYNKVVNLKMYVSRTS